jgi:hypothetical protein
MSPSATTLARSWWSISRSPSIQHYLIVNPVKKVVIHHARAQGSDISTRIASSGEIDLTPPGMTVPVAELLPAIE